MLRPLVMDFRTDASARDIGDQFMFGPALLVSPVTTYNARTRSVYLPTASGGWYDFWTGKAATGGQTVQADAAFDSIPVYVRAGSIVPMGPELQYTSEKPADPLTVWVYTGADAAFDLYEDDGVTYGYEKGAFATIPLRWAEARGALTLGARTGSFPGMLAAREVRVVFVSPAAAVPHSAAPVPAQVVRYDGAAITVKAPGRP
jgi:alpha-D-xyloside xylohydrolase